MPPTVSIGTSRASSKTGVTKRASAVTTARSPRSSVTAPKGLAPADHTLVRPAPSETRSGIFLDTRQIAAQPRTSYSDSTLP